MQITLNEIQEEVFTFIRLKNSECEKLSEEIKEIIGSPIQEEISHKTFMCSGDYLNDKDLSSLLFRSIKVTV